MTADRATGDDVHACGLPGMSDVYTLSTGRADLHSVGWSIASLNSAQAKERKKIVKKSSYLYLMVLAILLSGCSTAAPKYQPSMENVGTLQNSKFSQVKVGTFVAGGKDKSKVNELSIRGGSFVSPFNGSYPEYLRDALRQEFSMVGILNDSSDLEISGVLLKNEIDVAVGTGSAALEAQITIRKQGAVRYDKVKSVRHEWESAFAAMIAVPKAHQNYPITFQKLLADFYNDAEFRQALK